MAGITEALQKEAGKQMVEKVLENVDKDKLVDAAVDAIGGVLKGNDDEKGEDQNSSGFMDTMMQKATGGGIGGIFGAFK